ncbi:hypothetical protein DS6A_95 [Mycobacterium phage DS6A]|uniref:Uncharacterized protein n=1 Tax=Mycobacterium phage DS6A TaxID=45764 RepID=G8I4K5_9CAUD|nr:hypothetical protein DS6A_95 [Mycobacterium phage DS6A]AER47649.1 hypothetical protein DS6A_95 [Mycobacterium phage DS6A]
MNTTTATQFPMIKRLRAGLYEARVGGERFTIEQRWDLPGQPWRVSSEDYFDSWRGDFASLRAARQALEVK